MKRSKLLHRILSNKEGSGMLLNYLSTSLNLSVCIEDIDGVVLLGARSQTHSEKVPVVLDGEIVAWMSGDPMVATLAAWLNAELVRASGQQKLGNEVLHLYREINLIYNFSEKLADTIEPDTIARMALEEAGRLLPFNQGVVILWDEQHLRFDILATSGIPLMQKSDLFREESFIRKIAASDHTAIAHDLTNIDDKPHLRALMYAALKVKNRSVGSIILASNEQVNYTAADLKLLTTLALQSASAIESALLYEKTVQEALDREEAIRRIHEVTNKFVPHEFLRALGRNSLTDLRLGDHVERTVTVMFTDVRDYTTLAEQMSPEENFRFVNELNGMIGPLVRKNNGFVNQYLGDGVMAIFPGRAEDALKAAVAIQKSIQQFNKDRKSLHQQPVKIGIGMHTGSLIMGIIGDRERMDAATISDTVNTAARIEGLTKFYHASILLSKETLEQISTPDSFALRYLGKVRVKGKQTLVHIHECFDGDAAQNRQGKQAAREVFARALSCYLAKDFPAATLAFQEALLLHTGDETVQYFLEKSKQYMFSGVPDDWAGVEEIASI